MVPVKAEISEAVAKPKDARASVILPENTPRGEPKETAGGEPPAALIPQTAREIPNALGKFVRHVEMGSATLEWPADLGPVQGARFEERVLSLSGDALQIGWALIPDVSITPAGDRITAELRGLAPGTFYTVRLATGKDPDVAVLFTSDFWTVAKKPFFTGSLRTPLFVVALIALLFAVWRARNPKMPVKT
jgi:hypothetical protein